MNLIPAKSSNEREIYLRNKNRQRLTLQEEVTEEADDIKSSTSEAIKRYSMGEEYVRGKRVFRIVIRPVNAPRPLATHFQYIVVKKKKRIVMHQD